MLKNVLQTSARLYRSRVTIHDYSILKRFAGHSKWANIKHDKGVKDQERAVMFTKLGRMMKVAIQEGGSDDPSKNMKLQQVIDQCRRINMPIATIQSVIKSCKVDKSQCKSYLLEINGPGSCIILLEVFTDNMHVFRQNLASLLKKFKSKFSEGARHLFEEKGIVETDLPALLEDRQPEDVIELATEHAIEAGAEDVRLLDGPQLQFVCGASGLKGVQQGLEGLRYTIRSASVEFVPLKEQALRPDDLELCAKLIGKLDTMPEVLRISDNVAQE